MGKAAARMVGGFVCLGLLLVIGGPGLRGAGRPGRSEAAASARLLPPSAVPIGDAERADDRRAWEVRRLRDPATGRIPPGIHARERAFAAGLPQRQTGHGIGGGRARGKNAQWSARGPWNFGGRTRALAVDLADPTGRTLLAGGVSGGMWRSEDAGESWVLTTGSSQLHSVTCVLQDRRPGREHVWWYGTGEVTGNSTGRGGDTYFGDGIFKSTDGGRSWTVLASTSTNLPQVADQPFDGVTGLAQDLTNAAAAELYAATRLGIHRSLDGGESWTGVLGTRWRQSAYTEVAVDGAGTVYATLGADGSERGIFRSDDGENWTLVSPAGLDPTHRRIAIGTAPGLPGFVYFLTSSLEDSRRHQLWLHYHAPDGAGQDLWFDRSASIARLWDPWNEEGFTYSLNTQRGYNLHVAVSPQAPATVFLGGVHLWRSSEAFASAESALRVGGYYYPADDTHHADQHRLVFVPGSPGAAYSATDGGVHHTDDIYARRVQWRSLNNGYNTTQFYTVAIDEDAPGDPVIVGGAQDHGTLWTGSGDGREPWRLVLGGDGSHCAVLDAAAGRYVLSTYFGWTFRVRIAADGTVERVQQINPRALANYDCLFINPFLVPPGDQSTIYMASRRGVWRNSDYTTATWGDDGIRDDGWIALTDGPFMTAITALGTGRDADHDLYFGTETGEIYRVADAREGAGRTPVRLGETAPLPRDAQVSAIAVHPADQRRLLVGYGNYGVSSLWYSADGGETWMDVENNLGGPDGPSIRTLAIMADGDRELWLCGTSIGLFSATGSDLGRTVWVLEAPQEIGNVIVDDLAVRPGDRRVVAATHGRGIFSATVPEQWWDGRPLPDLPPVSMAQNAPNPFNGGTNVAYWLPAPGHVRIEILDPRGRRVGVLVDGEMPAGDHVAAWDGCDGQGRPVAAGTYLCRLEALGVVRVGKMTCVR